MTRLRPETPQSALPRSAFAACAALCLALGACDSDDEPTSTKDTAVQEDSRGAAGSQGAAGSKAEDDKSSSESDGKAGSGGENAAASGGAGGGAGKSAAGSGGAGGSAGKAAAASGGAGGTGGSGGAGGQSAPDAPKGPVVTAVWVRGADVNQTYLFASGDLPRGEVDLKSALELPDGTLTSYGKAVFFLNWEDNTIDRFEVGANNKLERKARLSFANYGIMNAFSWNVLFFSAERAYYVDPDGARVLLWNPKSMEILEERPAPALAKMGFGVRIGKQHKVGDRFITSALRSNEEGTDIDRLALALVFKDDKAEPVRVIEDTRCPGTGTSFADGNGDVYMLGDAYGGYLAIGYGLDVGSPCVLRIKKDEDKFDPDFRFDVGEVAKARAVQGLWHVADRKFVLQSWPQSVDPKPLITEPDDYWTADALQWKLVDLDAKSVSDVRGIGDSAPYQLIDFRVDGVTHLLKHEDNDVSEAGKSTLYALKQSAEAEAIASTNGDFWFIARLSTTD